MEETPKLRNIKKSHHRSLSADAVDFVNSKKVRSPNFSPSLVIPPKRYHGSKEALLKIDPILLPKVDVDAYKNPAARQRALSEAFLPNNTYHYRSHLYSTPAVTRSPMNAAYPVNNDEKDKLLDDHSHHSSQVSSLQNYSAKLPIKRSFRRLLFLIITEPQTSYASAVCSTVCECSAHTPNMLS